MHRVNPSHPIRSHWVRDDPAPLPPIPSKLDRFFEICYFKKEFSAFPQRKTFMDLYQSQKKYFETAYRAGEHG
ncbi:MAG TPA: hypothetical protein VFA47_10135, partial [Candidatus Manganitrophaceae bacterium]|nr:hypothetical protein [Candidatus Manganitrophaceae bacterium]